jgi:ribosomal protein L7/L12
MKNKFDLNTLSYLKLIKDLSVEIGISLEEAKSLVDTALHFKNPKKINYQELKEEILTFLVINMFSLICKL